MGSHAQGIGAAMHSPSVPVGLPASRMRHAYCVRKQAACACISNVLHQGTNRI